jgi:hypothetical protein
MEKTKAISMTFIAIGLILLLHHYIFWQRIADPGDILHHEFFEAIFLTAGITLLVSCHHHTKRREQ